MLKYSKNYQTKSIWEQYLIKLDPKITLSIELILMKAKRSTEEVQVHRREINAINFHDTLSN